MPRRELDEALVRRHLETVLSSSEFVRSDRMCRFLRFVVERSLAGEEDCLKESVIGVQVFDRESGYDPKTDAIVRVEARRLRGKLLEYATRGGNQDPLSITLPKGGYIPEFEMRDLAPDAPQPPVPQFRFWTRRSVIAAGAALAGSAVASLWASKFREPRMDLIQSRSFTSWPGYETTPAFSPDGMTIAFGAGAIYLQRVDSEKAVRLTHSTGSEASPRFSPDGSQVAFVRQEPEGALGIYVISVAGADERRLTGIHEPAAIARIDWSGDSRHVIFHDTDAGKVRFAFVTVSSGARHWIPMPQQPDAGDWWPAVSPDGTQLAFLRESVQNINDVYIMPLRIHPDGSVETRTPRRITDDHRDIYGLAWTADGRGLVIASRRQSGRFDLWRVRLPGGAMMQLSNAEADNIMPAVARTGNRLAFVSRFTDINIWRVGANGQAPAALLISSTLLDSSPQYSPDGKSIAFRSNRSGGNEIWISDAEGANSRRLTNFGTVGAGAPKWSPDGRQLVFHARQGDSSDVYIVDANGSGQPRRMTTQPGNAWAPSWSRDGRYIYFGSKQTGDWQIWKQSVAAGAAERITTHGGYAAIESIDGKCLYYCKGNAAPGIFRYPGEALVVPELSPAMWGNWSPAARGIYYIDYLEAQANIARIQYFDLEQQTTRLVATIAQKPGVGDAGLAVSPDEAWLLYAQVDRAGSDIMLAEGFETRA